MKTFFLCCLALAFVWWPLQAQTEKQLIRRGLDRLQAREFEGAEADFSYVLQLNPRNGAAYFNRGFARLQLENYPGAVQDFSLSIDINPANPDAYYFRGRAKVGLEDYLGGMMDFNIAIRGEGREARYYRARAEAKSGLEDFRGAIQDLDKAIELTKGRDMDLVFDRAKAYISLRYFDQAIANLDIVVNERPMDPNAYNFRASVKLQAGDLDGACLDWSKAGELGDANAYTLIRKHCNN
ncbi:MAG: hypothetical protein D6722_11995 [Bacteroidetes bacterium]|nr:MAG: hypothetical protein D6722_11995 [Bacteroidota bacterium]